MNDHPLSVAEFNHAIDTHLRSLGVFQIRGEITELSETNRGGVFLVLKDTKEKATLSANNFKRSIRGIDLVEVGMEVQIIGVPIFYSPFGKLSIQVMEIAPVGEGALKKAFEKLRQKLEIEGIFDEDRKKLPPQFIQKIALITASGSAAESDFKRVIAESSIKYDVTVFPVHVQGKRAVSEIVETLSQDLRAFDAVVLTRGGGSLEDMIAFNDEEVVRAVARLGVYSLVAVGHEKDSCLSERAADKRASTPTHTGEFIDLYNSRILKLFGIRFRDAGEKIQKTIINIQSDAVDSVREMGYLLRRKSDAIAFEVKKHLTELRNSSKRFFDIENDILAKQKLLHSYSHEEVLRRGYAFVSKSTGEILSKKSDIFMDSKLRVHFQDGNISVFIDNKGEK